MAHDREAQRAFREAVLAAAPRPLRCNRCRRLVMEHRCEADHITPLAEGGADAPQNGQVLCLRCHHAKTARQNRRKPQTAQERRWAALVAEMVPEGAETS